MDQNTNPTKKRWLPLSFAILLPTLVIAYLVGWGFTSDTERVTVAVPLLFILLDYLAFELKTRDGPKEKDWSYEPRMRIWGLGALLGLGFLLLSKWGEIVGQLGNGTAGTVSKAALTLGVVALFIYGVVRLAGED